MQTTNYSERRIMSVISLDTNKATLKEVVKEEPKQKVVTGAELKDNEGVAVIQDTEDGTNMLIKMDGPLSKIYTDALNVYLAKEQYGNVSVATEQMLADATFLIKTMADNAKKDLYVYSLNADDLDSDETYADAYDEFSINIGDHTDYDKVVVLEAYKVRGAKLDKMHNCAIRNGAKVFYTRNAALEYIKDKFDYMVSESIGQDVLNKTQ